MVVGMGDWDDDELGVPGQPINLGGAVKEMDEGLKQWIKDKPSKTYLGGIGVNAPLQGMNTPSWNPYYPPTYPATTAFCNHLVGEVSIKVKEMEDELLELLEAIDAQKLGTAGTHVESLLEDLLQIRTALLL